MANLANIAATNMEHLCNCDLHGYSQSQRWGDESLGICYVECEGHTSIFYAGDRDCSSAVIDSWQEAIKGTNYEGVLDGASYTGNMRDVFTNSGLFSWQPMSFTAQRGDIYLNESDHTAMCVDDGSGSYGYDALAEFSISETGGIYGSSGDQTGSEAYIHGYYDYPWDGILHYEGPSEVSTPSTEGLTPIEESTPEPTPAASAWRGYGIDISSWQADLDPYSVDADFIIIKVSQGTGYENPTWRQQADATLNSGKALGLYHYAGGEDANSEAQAFLSKCNDYVGRALLCLDWESAENDAWGNSSWCDVFLNYVQSNTGTTPMLYGGQHLLSDCPSWPHWIAQYPDYEPTGYQDHPWNEGAYDCEIRQYASTGDIDGYNGNLDLDKAYISREQWEGYAAGSYSGGATYTSSSSSDQPRYNVYNDQWCGDMVGTHDTTGSSDDFAGTYGKTAHYIAIDGVGQYRVQSQSGGILDWVDHYDTNDFEYGCAGDDSAMIKLWIPDGSVHYQVHTLNGEWLPEMIGSYSTDGCGDDFAGNGNPIDCIRIWR